MRVLLVVGAVAVLATAVAASVLPADVTKSRLPASSVVRATGQVDGVDRDDMPGSETPGTAATTVPSPRPIPTFDDPELGVHVHALWDHYDDALRAQVFEELVAAGVRSIRVDIGWATLEEECRGCVGDWYVERLDRTVAQAREHGLEVLGVLWRTPSWAGGGQPEDVPVDPAEYARVAAWLAERYEGRIAAWELWNEPNLSHYFHGGLDEYVALVRAAAPAIRAADEAATVVLSGPANNDTPWLRGALERGAGSLVDVVAVHPYPTPSDDPPTLDDPDGDPGRFAHLATVLDVVADLAPGTPVWLTEFGWSSHTTETGVPLWEHGVTRARQGQYTVEALTLLRDRWPAVERAYLYRALDRATGRAHLDNFGLLDTEGEPKPVLHDLRRLMWGPRSAPASSGG